MVEITVVGGGIAGLVAAISVAEKCGRVTLEEARPGLGGRAHTANGTYKVNYGGHALYRYGAFEAWLCERELLPKVTFPSLTGLRLLSGGKLRRMPTPLLPMMRTGKLEAPADRSYRDWATERMGASAAEAAIGFASLPTFHADPGELCAEFVHERIRRSIAWRSVYYVIGGWQSLVDRLALHAEGLGVRIVTGSRRDALPAGPVIVATDLPTAARLLEDETLDWPRVDTAIFDVALAPRRGDPGAVLSLDDRVYASDFAARDDSLGRPGDRLIQASGGLRAGESTEDAFARIEGVLDRGFRDWRERVLWRRRAVAEGGAGPADPPGARWQDRPAIERGQDRWLAGDCVAAPGILSEVAFESGRRAAALCVEKCVGARASTARLELRERPRAVPRTAPRDPSRGCGRAR